MKFLFMSSWIIPLVLTMSSSSSFFVTTTSAFTPSSFSQPSFSKTKSTKPTTTTTSTTTRPNSSFVTSLASSSSSSLTSDEQRAKNVFNQFDVNDSGTITADELVNMLRTLDIEATESDANALLVYLDSDGDGAITFDDFLPWYRNAAESARDIAEQFQAILLGRRTVDQFDLTPVQDDVLERAIQCAISAPNRSMSEPWRFIKIGPKTVQEFAKLNEQIKMKTKEEEESSNTTNNKGAMETSDGMASSLDWTKIPGWCVVTTKLSPTNPEKELEDFKSTSCAVQNFMLSMWSEGIGTKWTSGPVQKTKEFADLCNVDTTKERVIGCIWYGFATGGLINADPKRRKKTVKDVLSILP